MQKSSHRKIAIISAIGLVTLAIVAGWLVFKYRAELPRRINSVPKRKPF